MLVFGKMLNLQMGRLSLLEIARNRTNNLVTLGLSLMLFLCYFQHFMDNLGNEEMDMKTATSDKNERLKCQQRCAFQTEKVTVTTSLYPSENTFLRRNDVCNVIAKIDKICSVPLRRDRFLIR